jgi:predicted amidohydrolase
MLAVVQFNPVRGARADNLAALAGLAEQACAAGARLVVLPEMAATGYRFPDAAAVAPLAEPARGPTWEALAPIARAHRAQLVVGYVERDGGRLYNAAQVIGPDGEPLARYRKRLLYRDDTTWARPGDLPYPAWQTPWGAATLGICMDLNDDRFVAHVLRTRPALVCFPTNWIDEGFDPRGYWVDRLDGHGGLLLAANRWGAEDGVGFSGRSSVLLGELLLAEAPPTGDGWAGVAWPPPGGAGRPPPSGAPAA